MTFRRPSAGTLLGATALVVAIAGTGAPAEAAKLINGKLIKAGTITSKQIKNGTITNADLAPGTLRTGGVGPAGPKGDAGPAGPKGDAGPAGPAGATGAVGATGAAGAPGAAGTNGVSGHEIVVASSSSVSGNGGTGSVTGSCPAGKKIFGATAYWLGQDSPVEIYPSGGTSATTWVAYAINHASGSDTLKLVLVCAFA
jgi:hypothetical protein